MPLFERLYLVLHLKESIQVCDVELLLYLVRPLLDQALKVKLSLTPVRHLALKELSKALDVREDILMLLNLILTLPLGVLDYGGLKLLVVILQVLKHSGDLHLGCDPAREIGEPES